MTLDWTTADGSRLEAGTEQLEDIAGIYVWRRALTYSDDILSSAERLETWLEESVRKPYAYVEDANLRNANKGRRVIRADWLQLGKVRLGGGALTSEQKKKLARIAGDLPKRMSLQSSLAGAMSKLGPVLYVGQAAPPRLLRQRISEHLGTTSDFSKRIKILGLSFACLKLEYAEVNDEDERDLLEAVLTHLLIAPLTIRPG